MEILKDGEIVLYGTVGRDVVYGEDGFAATDVIAALAELGRSADVTVRLNSGGGYAFEGVAIYNSLAAHPGNVRVVVEGIAASAASIIAMAGDEIVMRTGSTMMIHDPAGITLGTAEDHQAAVDRLEILANSMAEIYAEKTGRKVEEIRDEMRAETWMSARDAVARGYADRIEKGRAKQPTAFDFRIYSNAPERLVALAESRAWMCADSEAGQPAVSTGQEEYQMTTENGNGAAAEGIENNAEVLTEDEASAAETAEQVAARVRAEERQRAADITAACGMAGKPELAAKYIASDSSVSAVLAEMQAARAHSSADVSQRHNGHSQATASSWGKIADQINARR